MSENPFQIILKTYDTIVHSVQTHVSNFIGNHERHGNLFSTSLKATSDSTPTQRKDQSLDFNSFAKSKTAKPLTKEELGRATWTLLHSIAAQYPDHPTRQQKRDAKELMAILCRLYPCKECAGHFTEVIRANPVQAGSQAEFSQWMCHIHNVVNRSLGKVTFPCQRMDARWGKLECEDRACDLEGTSPS